MHEPPPGSDREPTSEDELLEVEVIDALPVRVSGQSLERAPRVMPQAQAAAVAATGFLAGAATLALLHRRNLRQVAQELADLKDLKNRYEAARHAPSAPFGLVPGRTYLIQIRALGRPAD